MIQEEQENEEVTKKRRKKQSSGEWTRLDSSAEKPVVQLLSHVRPHVAISQSLLRLTSMESVMPRTYPG